MRELAVSAGLSDQQAELIHNLVVKGLPVELAAVESGYNAKSVYRTLRIPAVAAAIAERIKFEFNSSAAGALHVAKTIMHDPKASERVRADIAFKILDRAGHGIPSKKDNSPQKALSEMTQGELLAFIEANQAAIDKATDELAGKAKDITRHNAPALDVKALNYLD